MKFRYFLAQGFFSLLMSLVAITSYSSELEIENILALSEAPEGVVFEVASGNEGYMKTALDQFENYKKRIREKFPKIDFAIVAHGQEQFSLTSKNRSKYQQTHERIEAISDDVSVHICETHAGWKGVTAEDYPDYIWVSRSGPSQVRAFQEMGYILVDL